MIIRFVRALSSALAEGGRDPAADPRPPLLYLAPYGSGAPTLNTSVRIACVEDVHVILQRGAESSPKSSSESSSESSPESIVECIVESVLHRIFHCSTQSSSHRIAHRSSLSSAHCSSHRLPKSSIESSRQSSSESSTQSSLQSSFHGFVECSPESSPPGDPYPWFPQLGANHNLPIIRVLGQFQDLSKTSPACIGSTRPWTVSFFATFQRRLTV